MSRMCIYVATCFDNSNRSEQSHPSASINLKHSIKRMKNQKLTSFYPAKVHWLAVAVVAMMVAAGQAKAQVINFDFPPGGGGTNFVGQGALSDPGDNYWNPVVF